MNSMDLLKNKRAVITGGSRGIGEAIAKAIANQGAEVFLIARDERKLRRIKEEIEGKGQKCDYVVADLSILENLERVQKALLDFGEYDIYVNNAALTRYEKPSETSCEDIDILFQTNFRSSMVMAKAAAKQMIQNNRKGAMVFITSINALSPLPSQAMYSATKAALESIMKSFASELGTYGIRVNSIAPGAIHTDMNPHFTPELMQEIGKRIPLGHVGEPDEIADVAVFLCSEGARYMTGSTVVVDGGYLLRR